MSKATRMAEMHRLHPCTGDLSITPMLSMRSCRCRLRHLALESDSLKMCCHPGGFPLRQWHVWRRVFQTG
jgi:hypothetical protein